MKKVGLYLDAPVTGGTFQYNLSILDAIKSFNSEEMQTAITYSSAFWESYLKEKNISAVKISRTYFSRLWFQLRTPLSIWRKTSKYFDSFSKTFLKQKCDLWVFPSQDIWSYSLPIPSLSVVHDLMHRYERNFFLEPSAKKDYIAREKHYRRMCKDSKGILVDSNLGKQQLIESYQVEESKVHILPFIAPHYIYEDTTDDTIKLELPSKYIFYPAKFWKHKNHKGLIKAALQLISKIPDLKIVFAGAPNDYYNSVKELIKKMSLENVFLFLDHVPENQMRTLYKKARALIMPTYFGPTNIPPLEAFATGCPIAVSNNYAMAEQVGDAGLHFAPNSTEEIADAIYKLWTNDKLVSTLIEKGFQKDANWNQAHFNKKLKEILHIAIEN